MSPTATKRALKKVQIQEAVALLNECLFDQDLRTVAITPNCDHQTETRDQDNFKKKNKLRSSALCRGYENVLSGNDFKRFAKPPDCPSLKTEYDFSTKTIFQNNPRIHDPVENNLPHLTVQSSHLKEDVVAVHPEDALDIAIAHLLEASSVSSSCNYNPSSKSCCHYKTEDHCIKTKSCLNDYSDCDLSRQILDNNAKHRDLDVKTAESGKSLLWETENKFNSKISKIPTNRNALSLRPCYDVYKHLHAKHTPGSHYHSKEEQSKQEQKRKLRKDIKVTEKHLRSLYDQLDSLNAEELRTGGFSYNTLPLPSKATGAGLVGNRHLKSKIKTLVEPSQREIDDFTELIQSVQEVEQESLQTKNNEIKRFPSIDALSTILDPKPLQYTPCARNDSTSV